MTETRHPDSGDRSLRGKRHVTRRVLQLVALALLSDLIVVAVELLAGMDPMEDFQQRPILYVYLLLGTVLAFGVFGYVLGSREALLDEMAITDPLTGLYNSRYFHERMRHALAAARRHGAPISLVLFDVDHFKKINDEYGHPVGDQVLRDIGEAMRSCHRAEEVAARVGGEEFGLLLPNTAPEAAVVAAERIREAARHVDVATNGDRSHTVTLSAGVACVEVSAQFDPATLYAQADQALYRAKRQGRDRVTVATKTLDKGPPNNDAPAETPPASLS